MENIIAITDKVRKMNRDLTKILLQSLLSCSKPFPHTTKFAGVIQLQIDNGIENWNHTNCPLVLMQQPF